MHSNWPCMVGMEHVFPLWNELCTNFGPTLYEVEATLHEIQVNFIWSSKLLRTKFGPTRAKFKVRTYFVRSSGLLHVKFWPTLYEIWGYFTRVRANFLHDADANANSSCAKTWSQPHTNFGPTSYELRAYFVRASDLLRLCFGLNFLHYAGANVNLSIEWNQSNFERTSIELFSRILSKHHSVLVLIQSLQFWEVHWRNIIKYVDSVNTTERRCNSEERSKLRTYVCWIK